MEMESGKHQQSELSILHEEIMSLVRERQSLLASLTPNLFVWEEDQSVTAQQQVWEEDESAAAQQQVWEEDESAAAQQQVWEAAQQQDREEEESASTWRIDGKATVKKTKMVEPAAVSGARPSWQPEGLENYFDSILQDMEDLGHRLLSTADNTCGKSDDPISLYKKTELFATASRLVDISGELSNNANVGKNVNVDVSAEDVARVELMLAAAFDSYEGEAVPSSVLASYAREKEAFASRAFASFAREKEMFASHAIAPYAREEGEEEAFVGGAMGEVFARDARVEAYAEQAFLSLEENMAPSNEFLRLCSNYLKRPDTYTKHLALIITEEEKKELEEEMKKKEEEEKKMKEEEEEKRKSKGKKKKKEKNKSKNKEDYDGVFGEDTKSKEYLKKRMVIEQGFFSNHRASWEQIWGSKIGRCGGFQDTTTLSPMHLTDCTPGITPQGSVAGTTLQIYSFEIELKADLKWPLCVYGVVAARDTVDRNRNLLFCRSRVSYQELTQDDPFLRLTGPGRAILALYPVDFEVELKIIDGDESQDRSLISLHLRYNRNDDSPLFHSSLCTGKLCLEPIHRTVQATIVGVHLAKGKWASKYGARVACSLLGPASPTREVVLLDTREELTVGADGYVPLSRNVLSVELEGGLKVVIQAYSESGSISAEGHVYINRPKHCNICQVECPVGDCLVEITVAWSCLVQDKMDLLTEGYAAQA